MSRWNDDKFPKEKPLVFYQGGKPIVPPLAMLDGLKVVLDNMISYIKHKVPANTVKFWRLQSPRHFSGGDWNQNGSCLMNQPLEKNEVCIFETCLDYTPRRKSCLCSIAMHITFPVQSPCAIKLQHLRSTYSDLIECLKFLNLACI